ncbi:MAG: ABC transporter permease, partial [Gluconobacter oxydans]
MTDHTPTGPSAAQPADRTPQWHLQGEQTAPVMVLSGTWQARAGNIPVFPKDGLKKAPGAHLSFQTSDLQAWDTGLV